jgi:hypothetical protein
MTVRGAEMDHVAIVTYLDEHFNRYRFGGVGLTVQTLIKLSPAHDDASHRYGFAVT